MNKQEETIVTEPYIIERAEAEWVAKALSTDNRRPVLTMAAIAYYDGSAVLVATDNHRLHVLRLGNVEKEFPVVLFDIRRVLHEAKYAKATHVSISQDFSEVQIGRQDGKRGGVFGPVYAPVLGTVEGRYPDFVRVIPETKNPASAIFAINSRYLADATLLSRTNAPRTVILSEGQNRPLRFQLPNDRPRWIAVVMPMAIAEGWGEDK